jgi:hypothetical protein
MEQQCYLFNQECEVAGKIFDEFCKLKDQKAYDAIVKARKR